jgi:hypothetical protein
VVAARCGDDASCGDFPSEQIGKGAARLEGPGVLQEFQFEDETDRIQAEVGAGGFEDRCAAHVGPDDSFDRGNALRIDLHDVHSGHLPKQPSMGLV